MKLVSLSHLPKNTDATMHACNARRKTTAAILSQFLWGWDDAFLLMVQMQIWNRG